MTEDDDAIIRAQLVHERIARLRAHQTAERKRLYAIAVQEFLDEGYSVRDAERALGLSKTFLHKISQHDTTPCDAEEFDAIDEATAQYVLDL